MGAYIIACEGEQIPAMFNACKAFLQGKVKRERSSFAPSAAEFADQVRHQQLIINAAGRPRLQKAVEMTEHLSEEHKAKMAHKLAILGRATKGDKNAERELQGMVPFKVEFMAHKPAEDIQ